MTITLPPPPGPPLPLPDRAQALERLRSMLRIRRFEEKCAELYGSMKIRGFLHLCIGQEAVAAGVMPCLQPTDAVVTTYREHGQALARGIAMGAVMAEMFGKLQGCSRGRGGSMHLFDAATRFFGGHAIVGSGMPLAVGLALADSLQHRPQVTACLFGDGAMAEGVSYESLNLAQLWRLPVLFLCENNLYAMGTALALSHAQTDLCAKARCHGMVAESVDGMDVLAVEQATRAAIEAVRKGEGPRFLEFRTYRFRAHSMFDAELYRDKAEVAAWKARDPIATFTARLRADAGLTEADVQELTAAVEAEVAAAIAFAEAGTPEDVGDLARFVYAEPS